MSDRDKACRRVTGNNKSTWSALEAVHTVIGYGNSVVCF